MLIRVILCLLATALCCNADFGSMEDLEEFKRCPAFKCPEGESPVHRSMKRFTSPGCTGWGGSISVGNEFGAFSGGLRRCCDQAHSCFQTCAMAKSACVNALTKCTTKVCKKLEDSADCLRESKALEFQISMGGCQQYNAAQEKACKCVKEESAVEKRRTVLQKFYEEKNPEKAGKVDELIAKYDSPQKFARLVQKLVAKYPKIVRHKRDPQQAKVEEILRKAQLGAFDEPGKPVRLETAEEEEAEEDALDLDGDEDNVNKNGEKEL